VLYGLSGVGKSRLTVEYMDRYGHEYRLAWRIRADEPTRLADDFAAMAKALGLLVPDPTDLPAIRAVVSRWLTEHDNWLLVFDDASKPEDIEPYLPSKIRGHVLVTSLNHAWGSIGTPRRLHHLTEDASVTFLLERTHRNNRTGAAEVAKLLGGLPLALAQAAGYMEKTQTGFSTYARLFQQQRGPLWEREEAPEDHDRRTVQASFSRSSRSSRSSELPSTCCGSAPSTPLTTRSRSG
jgi:hypothetical protein